MTHFNPARRSGENSKLAARSGSGVKDEEYCQTIQYNKIFLYCNRSQTATKVACNSIRNKLDCQDCAK